ncbi:hypothetical protein BD410DRAFT_837325 [Rickenella mellea]|uniref:Uncharacterized protein n=1 Tax=Rickenella mellea TaxID=50990 RepID=A0A4Y7QG99_9AGAM|nr:hypothetical protein BD410DRAFT_837325 [Rickenella mellea]
MHYQQLALDREKFRKDIKAAVEDDDPLAAYERFVKWTADSYSPDHLEESGLVELLEETARTFRDDPIYKQDMRYLELWVQYANHVDKPELVYGYLLENDIGTVYSQLYSQYAAVLEMNGRLQEAQDVYIRGIGRPCRGVATLKKRFSEFKARVLSKSTLKRPSKSTKVSSLTETGRLRSNPLRNFDLDKTVKPASHQSVDTRDASPSSSDPYAYMSAPPAPGKRPEKLQFNLSLLFKDGQEYCIQEARAKSLGLLNKKWPPPELASKPVNFNGSKGTNKDTTNNGNMNLTMSMVGEQTVTINTKEALMDVFAKFNSPDKPEKFLNVAGSKRAPVKKVDPTKPPAVKPTPITKRTLEIEGENRQSITKTPTFKPFVDNSASQKENATPAPKFNVFVDENANIATPGVGTFKPFIDENARKTPTVTPGNRKALALKEVVTPSVAPMALSENGTENIDSDRDQASPVFERVFTPAGVKEKTKWAKEEEENDDSEEESGDVFHDSVQYVEPPPQPVKIKPFVDAPAPVFSRPPEQEKNQPAPTIQPVFTPFEPSSSRRPTHAFDPRQKNVFYNPETETIEDPGDEDDFDNSVAEPEAQEIESEYYEEEESRHERIGRKFGQFDVMTPITERTFEYTSTRAFGTPSSTGSLGDRAFFNQDAVDAADRLAEAERELLPSVVEEHIDIAESSLSSRNPLEQRSDSPAMDDLAEHTGTLSLADALAAASVFKPPNPCIPSDPQIMSALLSRISPDSKYHDLRTQTANRLSELQKFANKLSRRSSGNNTTSSRSLALSPEVFRLQLDGRCFEVLYKLGEGGFGAVFAAKDKGMGEKPVDEDEDEFDEDEDDANMIALKVVKPRNVWEYNILRRIHSTLPLHCRPSVVLPHALYAFKDESFLVLDLCRQGTLLDVVNKAAVAGVSQQGGCLDEVLVMFFAIELLKFVEGMHTAGFIHGDLKIDNCLVRLEEVPGGAAAWSSLYQASGEGGWKYKGIKMIDFGRTIDTRMFPTGQKFIADWPTDARDCFEMREDRSWTHQTDYYGLAGIIHCMLVGKYFEPSTVVPSTPSAGQQTRYKLAVALKRYWQVDLWSRLFDVLLNPGLVHPDGSLPISDELADLRMEMEKWLQNNCNRSTNSLKGLLKKVERHVLS